MLHVYVPALVEGKWNTAHDMGHSPRDIGEMWIPTSSREGEGGSADIYRSVCKLHGSCGVTNRIDAFSCQVTCMKTCLYMCNAARGCIFIAVHLEHIELILCYRFKGIIIMLISLLQNTHKLKMSQVQNLYMYFCSSFLCA